LAWRLLIYLWPSYIPRPNYTGVYSGLEYILGCYTGTSVLRSQHVTIWLKRWTKARKKQAGSMLNRYHGSVQAIEKFPTFAVFRVEKGFVGNQNLSWNDLESTTIYFLGKTWKDRFYFLNSDKPQRSLVLLPVFLYLSIVSDSYNCSRDSLENWDLRVSWSCLVTFWA